MPPRGKSAPQKKAPPQELASPVPAGAKPEQAPDSVGQESAAPGSKEASAPTAVSPLDYMLSVMRDPAVEPARRDEMAKLALPYLHPKPTATESAGREGEPIDIADVSEIDIARRVAFTLARAAHAKPVQH